MSVVVPADGGHSPRRGVVVMIVAAVVLVVVWCGCVGWLAGRVDPPGPQPSQTVSPGSCAAAACLSPTPG